MASAAAMLSAGGSPAVTFQAARLSARTEWPSLARDGTRFRPMKPLAPVTVMFIVSSPIARFLGYRPQHPSCASSHRRTCSELCQNRTFGTGPVVQAELANAHE